MPHIPNEIGDWILEQNQSQRAWLIVNSQDALFFKRDWEGSWSTKERSDAKWRRSDLPTIKQALRTWLKARQQEGMVDWCIPIGPSWEACDKTRNRKFRKPAENPWECFDEASARWRRLPDQWSSPWLALGLTDTYGEENLAASAEEIDRIYQRLRRKAADDEGLIAKLDLNYQELREHDTRAALIETLPHLRKTFRSDENFVRRAADHIKQWTTAQTTFLRIYGEIEKYLEQIEQACTAALAIKRRRQKDLVAKCLFFGMGLLLIILVAAGVRLP